ncbi:hypothetical protein KR222_005880 [Zaprionus bogoriensis]|nr:hypothetical protein KR222_005880 [Zaprionus bogoriensis]
MDAAETQSPTAGEHSLNRAVAQLSDMEDISDVDIDVVVDQFHKTISSQPYNERRRSIFNTTLDMNESRPACGVDAAAVEAYAEQVAQEKRQWENFIAQSFPSRRGAAAATGAGTGNSCAYKPSAEQQAYLGQAPNLQSYIRGMGSFMNEGNRFLHEFEELRELHEGLKDICQLLVNGDQRLNIAECLAGE